MLMLMLAFDIVDMGVSINGGSTKWMVYKGKSHLEMDDWGYPYFRKPSYVLYIDVYIDTHVYI